MSLSILHKESEITPFESSVQRFLHDQLEPQDASILFSEGMQLVDEQRQQFFADLVEDVDRVIRGLPPIRLRGETVRYKWQPVGIRQFVCDSYYLNMESETYPFVLSEIEKMNTGDYQEVVLTGGIGCAKTTAALMSIAYQLYILSCMENPHKVFGLQRSSEILFVFQSINKIVSTNSFNRFKAMIEQSQYFKDRFPFNKDLASKLVFPNRIEVVPVSGAETAAIGQNVIGGLIDELNYMQTVQKSKQSVDGGTYDQAVALYNSIARRRKSRFLAHGKMPGLLCLVSSKRYPGQFTDLKEEEASRDPTIYIYDHRVWEVKPEGTFCGRWFHVFIGDESRKPRILQKDEEIAEKDSHLVMPIPVEYAEDFRGDIINALREIAGVSTLARHPYMVQTEDVAKCFGRHDSIFTRDDCDFVETKVGVLPNKFFKPDLPRWVHIDLGITGDSCGFAIGCVTGFKSMKDLGISQNDQEMMPMIRMDGILEIKPPRAGEILFFKVRQIITKLRELGLNIRWVSFDSFQSRDSMQLLKQQGFIVGEVSVDVLPCRPYDYTKSAAYTGRIAAPVHTLCQRELVSLERDTKTGRIDHPPNGSKDCADAMAGVVYGLTTRREIWSSFGVSTMRAPESIKYAVEKDDDDKPKVS